ncbi:MAG TPA: zinc metalloprotease HtpX [Actinomycetota bacterium]|jgi:heat shock protein HtpX|nr:zinc metalloprotease HtpX [Actinomycetota bacterium]
MAITRFPEDKGLSARMGLTMFLLGLLYVVFVAVLFVVIKSIVFVLVLAAVILFAQYYFSDKIALFSMGAKEVTREQAPELHEMVERLCVMADMPKPRVAIANTDVPNAFATGRTPEAAVVAVTRGIMRRLEPQELEAVLAHELSHVAHRDVAVMTIASFLGLVAGLLTRVLFYSGMFGGFGGDDRDGNGGAPVVMVVMLVSALVYVISFLLTRALSRYRELSADRSGAILTGAPSALASALTKISGDMGRIPTRDLRRAETVNALAFAPAVSKGFSLSSMFDTHPSLQARLEQLAQIEAELGRSG